MRYVAFLLGVNLGKRSIKMAELKNVLEKEGYTDVATVLASGNAIFSGPKASLSAIEKKLEKALEKQFGFEIGVIVRTMDEIEAMLRADPFKKVKMTKDIRRYVMFIGEKPKSPASPASPEPGYRILKATSGEVYSVLDLSKFAKTPDVMQFVRKHYGKRITTRNWNTIEKIAKLA
jgi:uncharacterized protein (DUF1697 family)